MGKHNRLIIESSGGVIQAVYTSDPALKVVLIDWDEAEEEEPPARSYPTSALADMPADTVVAATAVAQT